MKRYISVILFFLCFPVFAEARMISETENKLVMACLVMILILISLLVFILILYLLRLIFRNSGEVRHYDRERLGMILTAVNEAVIAVDSEERVHIMNAAASFLTGYLGMEAEGKPLNEVFRVVDTNDGPLVESPVRKVLKTGANFESQKHMKLLSADGSNHYIATRAFPLRNNAGRVDGAVLIFHDLSKEHEQENTAEMLAYILDNIPCIAFIKDAEDDFRYVYTNHAFNETHPIMAGKILGKTDFDLMPPDTARTLRDHDLAVFENIGESREFINDFSSFDPKARVFLTTKVAYLTKDDKKYLVGFCENQTEDTERDYRLQEASAEKQKIIDNVLSPIILWDKDGHILRANPAACAIAGKSEAEIMANPCCFNLCRQDIRPDFCPVDECRKTLKPSSSVMDINGRQYKVTAQPILDSSGKLVNVIENAFDITAEFEYQKGLKNAMESSRSAQEMSRAFLIGIGDKAKLPLERIAGAVNKLSEDTVCCRDEKCRGLLDTVQMSLTHLMRLARTLQELSEVEKKEPFPADAAAPSVPSAELLNPRAFLEDCAAQYNDEIREKEINLRIDIPDDMPEMKVDQESLKQAVSNLMNITFKYSEKNADITLSFWFVDGSSPDSKGVLHFVLCDPNTILSQDELETVFDASFVQGASECYRDAIGIAMVLTQRILSKAGGSVKIESDPEKGSSFILEIPAEKYIPEKTDSLPESTQGKTESIFSGTVLIIDDIDLNLAVFSAMLTKLNIRFFAASSAMEAIAILSKEHVDLIFTDIWMPGIGGEELVRKLAENPAHKDIPVVAVTADAVSSGDVSYTKIIKPMTLAKLKEFFELYRKTGTKKHVGGKMNGNLPS